jgi:hypothetical protein
MFLWAVLGTPVCCVQYGVSIGVLILKNGRKAVDTLHFSGNYKVFNFDAREVNGNAVISYEATGADANDTDIMKVGTSHLFGASGGGIDGSSDAQWGEMISGAAAGHTMLAFR